MQTVTQIKPAPDVVEQAGGRSGGGGGSSGTLWELGRPVPLAGEPPGMNPQGKAVNRGFITRICRGANLGLAILPWGRTLGEARSHIVLDD
jgi:hypothetical protein